MGINTQRNCVKLCLNVKRCEVFEKQIFSDLQLQCTLIHPHEKHCSDFIFVRVSMVITYLGVHMNV